MYKRQDVQKVEDMYTSSREYVVNHIPEKAKDYKDYICLLYTSNPFLNCMAVADGITIIDEITSIPITLIETEIVAPVSYTHLVLLGSGPVNALVENIPAKLMNGLSAAGGPVSYTHLDVYKRQLLHFPLDLNKLPQYKAFLEVFQVLLLFEELNFQHL